MEWPIFDLLTGQPMKGWLLNLEEPPDDLPTLLAWIEDSNIALYLPAIEKLISSYPQHEETLAMLQRLRRIPGKGMIAFEDIGIFKKSELADVCIQVAFSEEDYPEVRASAIMSLCRLGVDLQNYKRNLLDLLSETSFDLRLAAAAALAQMNLALGWRVLLQGLYSEIYEQLSSIYCLELISSITPPAHLQDGVLRWLESSLPYADNTDLYIRKRLIVYLLQHRLSKRFQIRLKNLFSRWLRQEQDRVLYLFRYLHALVAEKPIVVGQMSCFPSSSYKLSKENKIIIDFLMRIANQ